MSDRLDPSSVKRRVCSTCYELVDGDKLKFCPYCAGPHHAGCLASGCLQPGCAEARRADSKSFSSADPVAGSPAGSPLRRLALHLLVIGGAVIASDFLRITLHTWSSPWLLRSVTLQAAFGRVSMPGYIVAAPFLLLSGVMFVITLLTDIVRSSSRGDLLGSLAWLALDAWAIVFHLKLTFEMLAAVAMVNREGLAAFQPIVQIGAIAGLASICLGAAGSFLDEKPGRAMRCLMVSPLGMAASFWLIGAF